MEVISSIKDERIILARALHSRKGRQEHQRTLLEGEEILDWAIENHIPVEYILLSEKAPSKTREKVLSQTTHVFLVSEGILKKVIDTNYVIPLIGVARMPAGEAEDRGNFVVVLDAVQDFGNIGTIIRTCQAFGIRNIFSTSPDFDIYQRKTIEASRGSVFATRLRNFQDELETIGFLKEHGYQVVATSPRGSNLQSLVELQQQPVALVVGNETSGISPLFEEQADFLVQIPMSPAVESLNVGVATGISIYELRLKQVLAMIEQQIKSTLGRELNVAGNLVQQVLDAELRKVSNLTSQQVIFLMVLRCDKTMQLEDMCKQFGILERDAGEFLKPLQTAGLVVLNDNRLTLTEKGEEVLGKLWFTVESAEKKILSGFREDETRALAALLQRVQKACVRIIQGDEA